MYILIYYHFSLYSKVFWMEENRPGKKYEHIKMKKWISHGIQKLRHIAYTHFISSKTLWADETSGDVWDSWNMEYHPGKETNSLISEIPSASHNHELSSVQWSSSLVRKGISNNRTGSTQFHKKTLLLTELFTTLRNRKATISFIQCKITLKMYSQSV